MNPINNGGRPPRDARAADNGNTPAKTGNAPTRSSSPPVRILPAGTTPFHASAATARIVTRLTLSSHNTGAPRSTPLVSAGKQLATALEEHRAYMHQKRKREGNAG